MRKHLSFWVVLIVLIAIFGFSFAAKRTVTMWSFAANNVEEWKERKADIEKKFDIVLNIELVPQDAFVQKLQAVMMEGRGIPDIIEWMIENNRILNADPKKSFVLPLNVYVSKSEVFKKVIPGRVAWVKYGKNIYGLPHDVHPVVLIYNDTIWKKAGVDVAKIKTWDEFFEAAKKLTSEKKDGKPVNYALPSGNDGLGNTMFMIWQTTGSQILDGSGKPTFTSPEFVTFVKKWKQWYDSGVFTAWDWGNFAALVKNGTICAYLSPDWWVSQSDEASKVYNMKVRDLPLYKKGGPNTASWGGSFLAIPKGTKNPDEIYAIIEYMQYDKSAIKVAYEKTGMLRPLPDAWNDPVFNQPDPRFGGEKLAQLQIKLAKTMPSINTGDIFWDAINDFAEQYPKIMNNEISVEEGLKAAQDAAIKRLSK